MNEPERQTVNETVELLDAVVDRAIKDRDSINELFELATPRLLRMIRLRCQGAMQRRLEPEDILQETFVVASRRFDEFAEKRQVPIFVWLRGLALDRLVDEQRKHLGAAKRAVSHEVSKSDWLDASNLAMTQVWTSNEKSPSVNLSDQQRSEDLKEALKRMPDRYREVIVLRFFESLTTAETASAMGCSVANAKVLQYRAVKKLHEILIDEIGWKSVDRLG